MILKMNALERCLSVLRGEKPDRVPVVPQGFMYSVGVAGFKMKDVVFDGAKMARSHIICQEKFGYDGCVIDFDDATLAEACGARVIHRDDEPAIVDERAPVLKRLEDVEELELPDPEKSGRLPVWLEATRVLVEEIGDRVLIMGRADQGPFDLACLLRGSEQFMVDLMVEDPAKIHKVLAYCTKAGEIFAKAQKDAGAHVTSIGDSYAGPNLVSPDIYRQFALPYEIPLTRSVQDYGIYYAIHICGDTSTILEDMNKTKADILELDWQVDMGAARKIIDPGTVIMGNINPSDPLVFGSPEAVDKIARKIIEDTGGTGLFLSSGCAMGKNTPENNIRAMVQAAKKYGRFD
jgi:MtaA/CmuA family methyltransferase